MYLTDCATSWEKLLDLTCEHDCLTHVCPAQHTHDGRLGYNGSKGHFLGVNNVDNMSTHVECKLEAANYSGKKHDWNFKKYVKLHAILEGLVEHGYLGINTCSKVWHLLKGIKTMTFDSVKMRIVSDATLRTDFDACVSLFQDFIKQCSTTHTSQQLQEAHLAGVANKPLKISTNPMVAKSAPPSKTRSSMKNVKSVAIRGVPRTAHSLLVRTTSLRVRQL